MDPALGNPPPPQTFTVPDVIHPEILSIINLNVFKLSL